MSPTPADAPPGAAPPPGAPPAPPAAASPSAPVPPPVRPPGPARPRSWTTLALALVPLLALLGGAAAAAWWLVSTPAGLAAAVRLADAALPLSIRADGLSGSLRAGFAARHLKLDMPGLLLQVDDLQVDPRELAPARRLADLERVQAGRVEVRWGGGPPAPPGPPASLALPLTLVLRDLQIRELALGPRDGPLQTVVDLAASARLAPDRWTVERAAARWGTLQAQLGGRVDTARPFVLDAQATLASAWSGHPLGAVLQARGGLEAIELSATVDSDATRVQLDARITPWAAVPVERLGADLSGFDPAQWFDGAPTMLLAGRADITPDLRDGGFNASGPVALTNSRPGPVDKGRVPVRSARGTLAWDAGALRIDVAELQGTRGRASGQFERSADGALAAQARVSGLDAAAVVTTLRPTDLQGTVGWSLQADVQRVRASLRSATGLPLAAEADLTLRAGTLTIAPSRLTLGQGSARVAGTVRLQGDYATRLQATVQDLDLAQLAPGLKTRLAGAIEIDGALAPTARGTARLVLKDSVVQGLPLTGGGTLRLADELLDLDLALISGTARLSAQGGLGGGRALQLLLEVPDLQAFAPGVRGQATASLQLTGAWRAPAAELRGALADLAFAGGERIQSLKVAWAGQLAPDALFAATASLAGGSSPRGDDWSLGTASLVARGSLRNHSLELIGLTESRQRLRAVASGGWIDGAWRGALITAEAGRPFDLRVNRQIVLVLGPDLLQVGPADFELRRARFTEVEFTHDGRGTRTRGRFEGLQPQTFDPASRAVRRALRDRTDDRKPLTLAGRWDLRAEQQLNGSISFERTGGDLYAGIDLARPVGLTGATLKIEAVADKVSATLKATSAAAGKADAQAQVWVQRTGALAWALAPQRPLEVALDATANDLGWIAPLVSENVGMAGRAEARVLVKGTPEAPAATGSITGRDLRLDWIDQGVRLEGGVLDATLEDGVLELQQLRFTGAPRVRPLERRAAEGLDGKDTGEVTALGRLALRSLTGSFAVRANRLSLLQRPDRWLVASGEGGVTVRPQGIDVAARLRADGAYIDFGRAVQPGAPQLADDIVIVRGPVATSAAAPAPALPIRLQLTGDLGPRFFIRGAGVETRLAGQVELRGDSDALRAFGTVSTVGGVFQGYGQTLRLERGIVSFNGPPADPALNVLAIRPGLPVDVGVAITGSARRPLVRLYSDPPMDDVARLNWLVFGRPSGEGGDRAMLSAAAGALLGGQNDGPTTTLLRSLGVDELTIRPGGGDSTGILPRQSVAGTLRGGSTTTTSNEVVAVGTRISDRMTLGFEQALSGASYSVTISYQLSQRLSVVARTGTLNAVDLVYHWLLD